MKSKGRLLPLLCTLFATLIVPAGAAAKADSSFSFGERYAEAHLAGTHGYRITIHATSENLMVTARRGTASVTYFVFRKKLEGDRIDARLPGVGRVFLRFHERKRSRTRAPGNCPGSDGLTRKGVFVGLVKIRGDRDYTRAESRHVRGEIVREPRDKCRREATARASSADSEMISASTSRGRGFLSFFAFTMPSTRLRSNPLFGASLFRFRGGMAIAESQVAISKDPATLEIATPPRSATVDPPGPFTGKATFQQEAKDQFSWTGDLAVEMPGIGEVRLAGPKFETALCLGQRCRGDEDESEGTTTIAVLLPRAAAPTPSPWRWPGSPR